MIIDLAFNLCYYRRRDVRRAVLRAVRRAGLRLTEPDDLRRAVRLAVRRPVRRATRRAAGIVNSPLFDDSQIGICCF